MVKKNKGLWGKIADQKEFSRKDYFKITRTIMFIVSGLLIVSFIVFFAIAYFSKGGITGVLGYISKANMYIFFLAFLFEFASISMRFFKWLYYMKLLNVNIPLLKNFTIYLSLYSMNLTPGEIGRVVSAYSINTVSEHKLFALLPIVSFDIFTDFLGYVILSLIIAIIFPSYFLLFIPVAIILLLPFVFIISPWLFNKMKKRLRKGRLSKVFALYGEEYFAAQSKLNNNKVYLISIIFTVPSAVLTSLSVFFVTISLGIKSNVLQSILIYVVSQMVGMASFIPGTIGSADITMTTLIGSSFNVGSSLAASATIMVRFATLWFDVILGSIFLFYTFKYWSNKKHKST